MKPIGSGLESAYHTTLVRLDEFLDGAQPRKDELQIMKPVAKLWLRARGRRPVTTDEADCVCAEEPWPDF